MLDRELPGTATDKAWFALELRGPVLERRIRMTAS